jgi:hypothetical protein
MTGVVRCPRTMMHGSGISRIFSMIFHVDLTRQREQDLYIIYIEQEFINHSARVVHFK